METPFKAEAFLALDAASRKTGFAIYKDGVIAESGTWHLNPKEKWVDLENRIREVIRKYEITLIVAEDIFKNKDARHNTGYDVLCKCHGVLELISQYYYVPIQLMHSYDMKAHIWNKSRFVKVDPKERKERTIRVITNRYGYTLEHPNADDEADALGIAITHIELHNYEIKHPNTQ
jgi:Holliday junction resolvasome RuvABC endonuclease subunit